MIVSTCPFICVFVLLVIIQSGRGHWAVYYTSLQNFIKKSFLIRWLNNFGNFLIVWFIKMNFQTFQPLIVIFRKDNYMCSHWECLSVYRPLSCPFRSLIWSALLSHLFDPLPFKLLSTFCNMNISSIILKKRLKKKYQ